MQRASIAAVALLLGACTAVAPGRKVVSEGKEALDGAPLCCQDLSTAARLPLPLVPVTVQIDKNAPAFDFGGNKAFFLLYELPAYERPYSIFMTSEAAGTQQDVAVFIPRVALYDADHVVTRFYDERNLRNRGNNLERTVFVNPGNRAERYLAIYGSDLSASIERAYSMVTVQTVSTGLITFNLYSGTDGTSTLRSSPVGRVQIEVQGLKPAPK
jgi:hypothetical protein